MQLTVASGKGGVGKSSISASLSYIFSESMKVVAVDADADTPNLGILLGVDRWNGEEPLTGERVAVIDPVKCTGCGACAQHCPYECIKPEERHYIVNEVLCEGCNVCSVVCPEENVISFKPVVPGYVKFGKTRFGFPLYSGELLPGRPNSGKLVFKTKQLAKEVPSDIMVVDAAAGIGCSVIASVNGSDLVLVVVEPTKASLSDAFRLLKIVEHFGLKAVAVVNKFDINEEFSREIEKKLEERKVPTLGVIPYDKSVVDAVVVGRPPVEVHPDAPFSAAVRNLAENLKKFF